MTTFGRGVIHFCEFGIKVLLIFMTSSMWAVPASLSSVPVLVTTDKWNGASERWEKGRSPHPLPYHLLQNASRVKNICTVTNVSWGTKDSGTNFSSKIENLAAHGALINREYWFWGVNEWQQKKGLWFQVWGESAEVQPALITGK